MPQVEATSISRPRAPDSVPGYRLDHMVGKGGMGEVFQAVQLSLNRKVALKLLSQELAKDDAFVARFEKEGAALAALSHPNIVSIVDKGKTDTTYFIVMEFVDGPSLREVMRSPLYTTAQALHMFAQICRAIDYAHQRGIIHRDLKPENILFDEQAGGIAKVTDFGLAGFEDKNEKYNLTQTHVAMGTASYMAPEQMIDARKADARADIYSLGVVLYELLAGEVPKGAFDPVSSKRADIDKRLDGIVARCLKQQPGDRYQSVGDLMRDLEPLVPLSQMSFTAKSSPAQRLMRKAQEIGRKTARGAEAMVVLFALAVVTVALTRDKAKHNEVPAGIELSTDNGGKWPVTTTGRVDRSTQTLTLGDGPDTIPIQAIGRKAQVEKGAVVFPAPTDNRSGRAVLDVELMGDGLIFTADAQTQETRRSWFDPIRAIFMGPRPNARSALMLVGEPGRFVALVMPGDGQPPTLEWALGDRRGTMSSPLVISNTGGEIQLELKIDPATGELAALVGKGRDQRVIGDSVTLGRGWRSLFGETPRAAFGCLEGVCRFNNIEEKTLSLPAPPKPAEVSVVPTEDPVQEHHTQVAQAHNPPPPVHAPPPKQQQIHGPPPKKEPVRPVPGKRH
ncbi:MAG: serine/threonine-protein kinase [Myxococcaceae bacterium]